MIFRCGCHCRGAVGAPTAGATLETGIAQQVFDRRIQLNERHFIHKKFNSRCRPVEVESQVRKAPADIQIVDTADFLPRVGH